MVFSFFHAVRSISCGGLVFESWLREVSSLTMVQEDSSVFSLSTNTCISVAYPQLAGSPDLLAVPVHCGGGAAQHSHCSVQQEL